MKPISKTKNHLRQVIHGAVVLGLAFPAVSAMAASGAMEEITVVAQRREQSLQEVPIAVTALTADALQKAGITSTRELTQSMPALNFSRSNSAFQPTIRGVGTRGNSAGDESNVAVYVDGIYQPELSSLAFDLLKIERVEVLRGPQGTLFGRNSTGGLINVITPKPSLESLSGDISATYGRFEERSVRGYLTGGLSDNVAFDIAALAYRDEGYMDDLVNGGDIGERESYAVRTKLLVQPSDTSELVLSIQYSDMADGSSVKGQPLNGNTVARALNPNTIISTVPRDIAQSYPTDITYEQLMVALQANFDFDNVRLESTTSYQDNDVFVSTDSDATPVRTTTVDVQPRSEYYSQEFRLFSKDNEVVDWMTGVFLFSGYGGFDPLTITTTSGAKILRDTRQDVDSWAVFAEGTFHITDALDFTVGARYTAEDREYNFDQNGVSVLDNIDTDFSETTPRVMALYRFNDNLNVYASYSRGFKSGVFNAFGNNPDPVEPEILDAYEIGLKAEPLDWLRTNVSLFYYDYQDIQVSARDGTSGLIKLLNAASAESRGGEFELTAQVSDELAVRFFVTYLDAEYNDFPGAQVSVPLTDSLGNITYKGNRDVIIDASGNSMIRAPKTSMNLALDYQKPLDIGILGISGNIFYSDEYYWEFANRLVQPSYTLANAEISLTTLDERYRFSLWGKNLTDEDVFQQMLPSTSGDIVSYERPLTYGVSVSANFN